MTKTRRPPDDRPYGGSSPETRRALREVDFAYVNEVALELLPTLLQRWLPDGVLRGSEYISRNPTRTDRRPGSFKVNIHSGRWADFSSGDKGGDVVSLAAYLAGTGQAEAARNLARMLELGHE